MRYLPLILKNSVRNRRRSVLTIASLAVSLCLLGVVGALYTVLYIRDAAPAQARPGQPVARPALGLLFA